MSLLWVTATDRGPYYHGSNEDLPDGTTLQTIRQRHPGRDSYYDESPEQEWRADRVWATDSPYDASGWGKHVYEVHLDNPERHDAHDYDWDRTDFGNPDGQHHAPSGRVVRRLDPSEIEEPS